MALHGAVEDKAPTLIISLEMSTESLVDKMVCSNGMIDMRNLITGQVSPDESDRLVKSINQLMEAPIFIWNERSLNPQKLHALAVKHKLENNIQLLVVDYFQLMDGDDLTKNREQQLSDVGRALKTIAKELDIPVIILAQLNDDGRLRESRSLKMHADTITRINLSPKDPYRHYLKIEYNRDGEEARIPCIFHKRHGKFEQIIEAVSESD
jgi:replicative DNA helicase